MEQSEGILVAIVRQSIEFALCYLEKSGFSDDDQGIQVCLYYLASPGLDEVPSLMKVLFTDLERFWRSLI